MRAKDRAATRIQAGYRGYRVRKQLRMAQGKRMNGPRRVSSAGADAAAAAAQKAVSAATAAAAAAAPDAAPAVGNHTAAPAAAEDTRERSATKIQAGVRGFLVRRRKMAQQRAASTIQAGFRAFRARRNARLRAAATAK